jgi:hypothetical protein
MGCLLGCFEKYTLEETETIVENIENTFSEYYIDYYLAARFDSFD